MKVQKNRSVRDQEHLLIRNRINTSNRKFNRKDPRMMSIVTTMDFGPVDFMAQFSRNSGDIMMVATEEPITLPPTTTIISAVRIMSKSGVRRIPVTDAGTNRLEGMVTSTDIIDFLGGGSKNLLIENHFNGNFLAAVNGDIRSIMHDEVFYLERKARIADAIKIMIEKNIGGIPVVDDSKYVCGICTEKDFLGLVAGIPANRSINQYMSKEIEKASSDSTIRSAVRMMVSRGIRRIPVMEDDMLLGIITASDILGYMATGHAFESLVTGNFRETMKEPIVSLIKKDIVSVSADIDLGRAAQIMIDNGISSLAVMEDGVFCGIVTSKDMLKAISE